MPSLSQKYRPQTFADVTGQAHVTDTLAKEVATGKLGHAFLFCGPRGVGKTTTARIFAKALNCLNPKDGEPDNSCERCVAANEGRQIDLIEMDAATHTGVETVRESIIEHVRFAPMGGARKVYVLDEAHMLSSASWNALLKTLEEPPPYAFFILATTEWHKVPATIVSRCQRFEFKRVQDDVMRERVEFIAAQEGWKIDEEVTKLIVSRADGCVRDAETLLGQLGGLGEKHLTLDVAQLVIPPGHLPAAAALVGFWSRRDHVGAINEAQRLADEGLPLLPLFDDLITIVRKLLVASADPTLVDKWSKGTEDERAMVPLIGKFEPGELNDMALLLFERRKDAKSGIDALFALQLAGTIVAGGLLKNAGTVAPPPTVIASRSEAISAPAPKIASSPEAPRNDIVEPIPEPTPVPKAEPKTNQSLPVETVPSSVDLNTVRMKWAAIIRAVDEINHSLPFILKISKPEMIQGSTVVIRFQYGFHRDKIISDPRNRKTVEDAVRLVMVNDTLNIDGIVGEDVAAAEERSQDIVGNILKAFGGSVVES
ncbi:DNA polymerase III subunit gamma/tau [Candidatus Uhrbacteria bacterium]|nr:DNA polymerase III subunit gamma/tau [Candidatus Uhrbacteria bacterium]